MASLRTSTQPGAENAVLGHDAGQDLSRAHTPGQRVTIHAVNDRYYHYDMAGHLTGESLEGGTVKREYIWLGELPLAVLE